MWKRLATICMSRSGSGRNQRWDPRELRKKQQRSSRKKPIELLAPPMLQHLLFGVFCKLLGLFLGLALAFFFCTNKWLENWKNSSNRTALQSSYNRATLQSSHNRATLQSSHAREYALWPSRRPVRNFCSAQRQQTCSCVDSTAIKCSHITVTVAVSRKFTQGTIS